MTGEERLRQALRRLRPTKEPPPQPGGTDWPPWAEARLTTLQTRQRWLLAITIANLAVTLSTNTDNIPELVQAILQALTAIP